MCWTNYLRPKYFSKMKNPIKNVVMWIYGIPVFGDLICKANLSITRLLIPLLYSISGCKRLKFNNCIIWTPKNRRQSIMDGIEFLQVHDPELFSCLTTKQRLIFFYSNIPTAKSGGRFYGIDEGFIKWGSEGIATSIVESFFLFKASHGIVRVRFNERDRAAIKAVPQTVLDWMHKHSIRANLIDAYRSSSLIWMAQKSFQ
jgi:hypothetical protein